MPGITIKKSISIVIPCYNEEDGIPYLARQLNPAVAQLQERYQVELVFVDDGSIDKTNQLLHEHYGDAPYAKIVKHEKNKNLGAALKTGFAHATGDFIAALDSDCTYNPQLIHEMMSLMDNNTDIVTVSPYHPLGKINNVAAYRIFLSKSASFLYRLFLNWRLYTYTAMVRVYRKEVIQNISFDADNFLGVTELLVKAMIHGYRVKELPAALSVRKFGASKMKAVPLKVIASHLRLLAGIPGYRLKMRKKRMKKGKNA